MRFLRRLDHATPAGLDLHLILDNYTPPTKPRRSSAGWSGIPLPPPLRPDLGVVGQRR
jgi:hypothetical protein